MASMLQRALGWAMWFCISAARSPVQSLLSLAGLWYTGSLGPRAILGSMIEYCHRPRPEGVTLMTLPFEIRSMILTEMLVSETVVKPYNLTTPLSPTNLQACKQLNEEGTYLLYRRNLSIG